VVCVIAVVGVLAFTAVAVGEVGVSRHRAAAAADLSAIAGALAWPAPRSVVCARAAAVAARNGAVLADCTIDGAAVTVRVVLPVRALGAARADVTARARAATDGPGLLRADRALPRPAMQP
jgi:secretion/DNA translocation related TadE-like protein